MNPRSISKHVFIWVHTVAARVRGVQGLCIGKHGCAGSHDEYDDAMGGAEDGVSRRLAGQDREATVEEDSPSAEAVFRGLKAEGLLWSSPAKGCFAYEAR